MPDWSYNGTDLFGGTTGKTASSVNDPFNLEAFDFLDQLDAYDENYFANTGGDPFASPDTPALKTNLSKAVAVGDKGWEKILKGVLLYGDPFLKLLTKYNVIPNANAKYVANRQIDETELNNLLAKKPTTEPRSTILFGLDFGNPVIWIILFVILILIFSLLSKPKETAKKKI